MISRRSEFIHEILQTLREIVFFSGLCVTFSIFAKWIICHDSPAVSSAWLSTRENSHFLRRRSFSDRHLLVCLLQCAVFIGFIDPIGWNVLVISIGIFWKCKYFPWITCQMFHCNNIWRPGYDDYTGNTDLVHNFEFIQDFLLTKQGKCYAYML